MPHEGAGCFLPFVSQRVAVVASDNSTFQQKLDDEWEQHLDPESSEMFYYNIKTHVTQWEYPLDKGVCAATVLQVECALVLTASRHLCRDRYCQARLHSRLVQLRRAGAKLCRHSVGSTEGVHCLCLPHEGHVPWWLGPHLPRRYRGAGRAWNGYHTVLSVPGTPPFRRVRVPLRRLVTPLGCGLPEIPGGGVHGDDGGVSAGHGDLSPRLTHARPRARPFWCLVAVAWERGRPNQGAVCAGQLVPVRVLHEQRNGGRCVGLAAHLRG